MRRALLRLWLTFMLVFMPLVALPASAAAVDVFQPCSHGAGNSAVCKDVHSQSGSSKNPIVSFIKVIIQVVAVVVGAASIVIIIVSGLRLVSSAGDAKGVQAARNGVMYAAIGIIITIFAEALVALVLNKLK